MSACVAPLDINVTVSFLATYIEEIIRQVSNTLHNMFYSRSV